MGGIEGPGTREDAGRVKRLANSRIMIALGGALLGAAGTHFVERSGGNATPEESVGYTYTSESYGPSVESNIEASPGATEAVRILSDKLTLLGLHTTPEMESAAETTIGDYIKDHPFRAGPVVGHTEDGSGASSFDIQDPYADLQMAALLSPSINPAAKGVIIDYIQKHGRPVEQPHQ